MSADSIRAYSKGIAAAVGAVLSTLAIQFPVLAGYETAVQGLIGAITAIVVIAIANR